MADTSQKVPATASVVVVGAGISGLVAARELVKAGIDDVVVVDARDRIGGRVGRVERSDGHAVETGAELTGELQPTMLELAAEVGVEVVPLAMFRDPDDVGAAVHLIGDDRIVVPYEPGGRPGEIAPETAEALQDLLKEMPAEEPWLHPRAIELDNQTVAAWLEHNIDDPELRGMLEMELAAAGPPSSASMLSALAFLARHGGMSGFISALPSVFEGGTSRLLDKVADALGDRIALSAPVTRIVRAADGVEVETTRGSIRARAVIVAMEPNVAMRIEFEPQLPADRATLQSRWLGTLGAKASAVYETRFWREDGLSGFATGGEFLSIMSDFSRGDEGCLAGMIFLRPDNAARVSELLQDPDAAREAALADLERMFGPKARGLKELHVFDWFGDRWSAGVGGDQLQPGVLSAYGHTLRPPIGRIFWAGEFSGTGDYMEGAASAGKAAAKQVAAVVNG